MNYLENYLIKIELITGTSIINGEFVCTKENQVVLRNVYYLNDKNIVLPTMSLSLSDLKYVEILGEDGKNEYKNIVEKKGLKSVYLAECDKCIVKNEIKNDSNKKENDDKDLEKLISNIEIKDKEDVGRSRPTSVNEKRVVDEKKEHTSKITKDVDVKRESKENSEKENKEDDFKVKIENLDVKYGIDNSEADDSSYKQTYSSSILAKKEDKLKEEGSSENNSEVGSSYNDNRMSPKERKARNDEGINWGHKDHNERKTVEGGFDKNFQDFGDKKYISRDRNKSSFRKDSYFPRNKMGANLTASDGEGIQKKNIVYGWKVRKYKDGNDFYEAIKSKFTYNYDTNVSWGQNEGISCYETGKILYSNTFRRNRNNQKY